MLRGPAEGRGARYTDLIAECGTLRASEAREPGGAASSGWLVSRPALLGGLRGTSLPVRAPLPRRQLESCRLRSKMIGDDDEERQNNSH